MIEDHNIAQGEAEGVDIRRGEALGFGDDLALRAAERLSVDEELAPRTKFRRDVYDRATGAIVSRMRRHHHRPGQAIVIAKETFARERFGMDDMLLWAFGEREEAIAGDGEDMDVRIVGDMRDGPEDAREEGAPAVGSEMADLRFA